MKYFTMTLCVLAISLVFFTTSSFAKQPIIFDIGGIRLGDKLGEKLTPEFIYNSCPAIDEGKPDTVCRKTIKIGGDRDVMVLYVIDEYALVAVIINFESSLYDIMVDTFTTKFGQRPHSSTEATVMTGMGVPYTNEISVWNTTDGKFTIEKYGGNINDGRAVIDSPAFGKSIARKKAEAQKKLGDQL